MTTQDITNKTIAEAVANGVAALGIGHLVGDQTIAYPVPPGWTVETFDLAGHEDKPRHHSGTFPFVSVRSLAQYLAKYKTSNCIGYINDIDASAMFDSRQVAKYVLNDHGRDVPDTRDHVATLHLRPTAEAVRWAKAVGNFSQEGLLDLIIDGISEIAEPDGATLRELVSDLNAVRNTSVKSVIRANGNVGLQCEDNVTLSSGPGNTVPLPETIKVVFTPFVSFPYRIVLDFRVKAQVRDQQVIFTLSAPGLRAALQNLLGEIAAELTEATGIEPLWTL